MENIEIRLKNEVLKSGIIDYEFSIEGYIDANSTEVLVEGLNRLQKYFNEN